MKIENWKLKVESWKLRVKSKELKIESACANIDKKNIQVEYNEKISIINFDCLLWMIGKLAVWIIKVFCL